MNNKIKLINFSLGLLLLSVSFNLSCNAQVVKPRLEPGAILINQVGYTPSSIKIALIRSASKNFTIQSNLTGEIVFQGITGKPSYWSFSGDTARTADFSAVTLPGKYRLCIDGNKKSSYEFVISDNVYHDVSLAAIRAFYLTRASAPVKKTYGGKWSRPAGHPDTVVFVHSSAATAQRPEGFKISSPGGWYDAGDYNKYIVNSGISTYTLLLFYQMFPEYCQSLKTSIPESSNTIPDVMDEILWNLKWMLTMQDPNDGGVYHKLTNKSFDAFVMPDKANTTRYVVQKSTAATLDFAAVMAMASRIFSADSHPELKALSATCLEASKHAMGWAKQHPGNYYNQPADIFTGGYGDKNVKDEFFWAETEIALATNETLSFKTEALQKMDLKLQSWGQVEMLGMISLSLQNNASKAMAAKKIIIFANQLLEKYTNSPYKVGIDFFNWGSNSDVANQALVKIVAFRLTGDKKYIAAIQGDVDYILGRNPTGYCFITGIGSKSPQFIHHRISAADGVAEPIPGLLAGGPNTVLFNDCNDKGTRSPFPAKAYNDSECSYSTNEIAINWNAPLFFMMGALDAMSIK